MGPANSMASMDQRHNAAVAAQSLSHVKFSTCNSMLKLSRLLCPWDFPGKNTGVGCHFLLQGIFLTQGSNSCLLHWQVDSLPLSHLGSPIDTILAVKGGGELSRHRDLATVRTKNMVMGPQGGHTLYSVQFSHSVTSDSLRPHELEHARPPCPSPTSGVHSNSHPRSW